MTVICRTYEREDEARRAVDALLAAGVAGGAIRVLMSEAPHDARAGAQGDYAGAPAPRDATAGYAGQRSEGAGVSGAFAGTPGSQRGGSFADADRDTVTSYPGGVERRHVAGHRELRRLLLD